jgi:hypothetical protein
LFQLCTGSLGCDGGTEVRPASYVLLVISAPVFVAAPYVAARVSGRASAVRAAALSVALAEGA